MSDRGAFLSALDWIGRPSQVVMNALQGRGKSAGRQLLQMGADLVDLIPGDWLPNDIATKEDETSGSEMFGVDKEKHPWLAFGADVAGGMAFDPLTYIPGGLALKGLKGATGLAGKGATKVITKVAGAEAATAAAKAVDEFGRGVRRTFDAERLSPLAQKIRRAGNTSKAKETQAGAEALQQSKLAGLSDADASILGDTIDNIRRDGGRIVGELSDLPSALERLGAHPGVTAENIERLRAALPDALNIGRNQKKLPGIYTAQDQANLPDEYLMRQYHGQTEEQALNEALGLSPTRQAATGSTKSRKLLTPEEIQGHLDQNPDLSFERNATKRVAGRIDQGGKLAQRATVGQELIEAARRGEIELPQELIEEAAGAVPKFKPPIPDSSATRGVDMLSGMGPHGIEDVNMGFHDSTLPPPVSRQKPIDMMSGMGPGGIDEAIAGHGVDAANTGRAKPPPSNAPRQFTETELAKAKENILGKDFVYTDPESHKVIDGLLRSMADTDAESARALLTDFKGMPARGAFMDILAKSARPFKQAAVMGIAIPKIGSISRNAFSGIWQAMSNRESRGVALKQLGHLDGTLVGAITDAVGLRYGRDRFRGVLKDIDAAMGQSGGLSQNAVDALRAAGKSDAADVIQSGVLEGYIRADQIAAEMARTGWKKHFANVWNWPAKIFKGVEDRMRVGMLLDLKGSGRSLDDAARITNDSLYKYSVNTVENRAARDVIPFFQFTAKAIPQQAKLLVEKPWLATGMAAAMQEREENPIYPYMEGKLNIPLGAGEDGNQQYATGLGLPFEALNAVPNLGDSFENMGRQFKKSVVGSMNPLLKTAFADVSGQDPYFETTYGSYGKVPIIGEAGEAGRFYNKLAGTGLIQPLDSVLRPISQIMDERKSPGVKALDMLTGVSVSSVDEDRALQQQLEATLKANPKVRQYRTFYQGDDEDPETADVIQQYHDAKARVKAKRGGLGML